MRLITHPGLELLFFFLISNSAFTGFCAAVLRRCVHTEQLDCRGPWCLSDLHEKRGKEAAVLLQGK